MGQLFKKILNTNTIPLIGIIVAFLILQPSNALAQARDNSTPIKSGFDWDNVIVGGNFGANFGSRLTFVEISPTIGYLFHENWLAGIGSRYIYFEDKRFVNDVLITNIYGGGVFSQYYFLENFIAHAEYELLNLQSRINDQGRVNISSVLVGGGYRSTLGGNSFASILLLYNLNEDINSPYDNPVIRINFGIGL